MTIQIIRITTADNGHDATMCLVVIKKYHTFMLHLAFNFIVVILIGVAVYLQERKSSPAKYKPISTNGHANGIPKPYSDNEEEELFMNSC